LHINLNRHKYHHSPYHHHSYPYWNVYDYGYYAPAYHGGYYASATYIGGYPVSYPYSSPVYNTYETNNYYDDAAYGTPYTGTSYDGTAYDGTAYDGSAYDNRGTGYPTDDGSYTTQSPGQLSHIDMGMRAFQIGDYGLARREFVRAMLAVPDDPELVMLYGYAHFATGDYLVASLAIRRALRDDPTLIDQPVDILRLYGDPDDFEKHLAELDGHLGRDALDMDARFLAGFVRYAGGRPEAAVEFFARGAAESPDDLLWLIMRDTATRAETVRSAAERAGETGIIPDERTPESGNEQETPEPDSF
jgi:tetratricopeptide (TPR) repeat protein